MKKGIFAALFCMMLFSGCQGTQNRVKLDPKYPVNIVVWHYYNGSQKKAFDQLVDEFNETVGADLGIIVEGHNQGDVNQLEQSVMASINKEVGSGDLPNIFASYADNAYTVEKMGYLAELDAYLSEKEQAEYVAGYMEEGRIGANGELKIFPTAKSTEVMMLNQTAWEEFAGATGASLAELSTKEGVVRTAEAYYHYTDSLTPDIPDDGRAFYGRDAVANLFIIGSMELGAELFHVENQKVTLQVDKEAMRRIWDVYYIPHIKGYFASIGRFRSDDARVGKIIALTGSTSSASYFPTEVVDGDKASPIEVLVLPEPVFEGGERYAVQQGAGMVVTKASKEEEYASVVFLKWFTDQERNLNFSYQSGYLPVKKAANDFSLLESVFDTEEKINETVLRDTLAVAFDTVAEAKMYTNKAFEHGSEARKILEHDLTDKMQADLLQIEKHMAEGMSRDEAVALFDTEENFDAWFRAFQEKLADTVD